uniref:Uncharacterized protein n=1 Tax=viral metagenome TaxID=1070528 RepID=A0A6C0BZR0_9ZZZZ
MHVISVFKHLCARLNTHEISVPYSQREASLMPSPVAVPPTPLLRRETSIYPSMMATVPACPPTLLPPAHAPPPTAAAPCPPGKNMEATGEGAAPAPQKRARSAKGTAQEKKVPEEPAAMAGAETIEDMKTPESGSWLIVAKAVRMHLKSHETAMHCGSDALPALNLKLADMIQGAIVRAKSNGRKTLKACDF